MKYIKRLPDKQDKVQHNMRSELPIHPFRKIAYIPLVMYCRCGEILDKTSFNYCDKCFSDNVLDIIK